MFTNPGSMLEWLMGTDCKSAGNAYAGSNPARPNLRVCKLNFELVQFVSLEFLGIDGSRTRNFRLDRAVL